MGRVIIEIDAEGVMSPITPDGDELPDGEMRSDFLDCTKSGDCEDACRYILEAYDVEFRTVIKHDDGYKNVVATAKHKKETCEAIYFESESDFSDEDMANMYLIWESASQLDQS